ncbi:MAG: hypothetical protein V3S11_00915 [Elusimicrobiota bacterium]
MLRVLLLAVAVVSANLVLTGCKGHGKFFAPGQLKKITGYNPASGKMQPKKGKKHKGR